MRHLPPLQGPAQCSGQYDTRGCGTALPPSGRQVRPAAGAVVSVLVRSNDWSIDAAGNLNPSGEFEKTII